LDEVLLHSRDTITDETQHSALTSVGVKLNARVNETTRYKRARNSDPDRLPSGFFWDEDESCRCDASDEEDNGNDVSWAHLPGGTVTVTRRDRAAGHRNAQIRRFRRS
jgi:hypothetical protein